MIRFSLILLLLLSFVFCSAQSVDSNFRQPDTGKTFLHAKPDTSKLRNLRFMADTSWKQFAASYSNEKAGTTDKEFIFFGSPFHPLLIESDRKVFHGKEDFFYSILTIFLFFAFVKNAFPKYLNDLFRVAFRTTLKQRQIGEQLIQTPLPSLFMNILFLLSGAMYIDLLFRHYQLAASYSFWILFCYILTGLMVMYLVKFLSLKLSGLLFNIRQTTDAYIFIVFMINKIIGIILLPFLVLLAFTTNEFFQFGLVLSYMGVFILLAYRFILSYGLVRNQIRVKPFHFFLYLCCFEIAPLLLIYKLLLHWV